MLLNAIPKDVYIQQDTTITFLRFRTTTWWAALEKWHTIFMGRKSIPIPDLIMPTDRCVPQYIFDERFKVKIQERSEWENKKDLFKTEAIVVYVHWWLENGFRWWNRNLLSEYFSRTNILIGNICNGTNSKLKSSLSSSVPKHYKKITSQRDNNFTIISPDSHM